MCLSSPRSLLAGLAFALVVAGPALAADDAKARQRLDEVAKAYKGLSAYTDKGSFSLSATIDGNAETQTSPVPISLTRPNKLSLTAESVRLISDGNTLTTVVEPFKKYSQEPAPKQLTFETFRQGPAGSVLFGGPSGPAMYIVLNLLVGDDPVKAIADLGGDLKVEGDNALLIDHGQGPDVRLVIDPATKLLKGVDLVFDPADLKKSVPEGRKVAIEKFGWSAGAVETKPAKDDSFAFTVPKGYTKVEPAAVAEGEGGKFPAQDLVGKPAPDFTMTILDGSGKTRTIAKADLAGKIVMIDFWATWCGPCLAELPDIQKLVEGYAKSKRDVVIVALSQDQRPSDLAEVRKLVEKTLVEKNVRLTTTPVGLIGLDPSGTVGEAFQVTALPTIVILDDKGVVQAVHIGKNSSEVLSKDIDKLLDGKK